LPAFPQRRGGERDLHAVCGKRIEKENQGRNSGKNQEETLLGNEVKEGGAIPGVITPQKPNHNSPRLWGWGKPFWVGAREEKGGQGRSGGKWRKSRDDVPHPEGEKKVGGHSLGR